MKLKFVGLCVFALTVFFIESSTVVAAPATNGLEGYWNFDEIESGPVSDSSGNGNVGTLFGFGDGDVGPNPSDDIPADVQVANVKSLEFDGSDDYVSVSNPFDTSSDDFTIALWVNPAALNTGDYAAIIGREYTEDADRAPSLWVNPDNNGLHFDSMDVLGGTHYNGVINGFFTQPDEWVHIAWVKDGATYDFYRNGEIILADQAASSTFYTGDVDYFIGNADDKYFSGKIDDVRIYNRGLSASEVADLTGYVPLGITGSTELQGLINTPIEINDIEIVGSETDPIPVKLLVTNGTLDMTTTSGLTFFAADGTTDGPQTGSELYFSGDMSDINAALATLTYTRTTEGSDTLEVSLVEPGEVFFSGTGNLYEYIPGVVTWTTAEAAAKLLRRYGADGYLTTITSAEENSFVAERLQNAGWMGASDAASENDWKWVTGPEAGTSFYLGDENGAAVGVNYENWSDGEPNDSSDEDCAQFLAGGSGEWNDLPCTVTTLPGYVAEFGTAAKRPTVTALDVTITTTLSPQAIIENYADTNGSSTAPTIENYTDAGITGVTTDNLDAINAMLANNDPADVATTEDLQSAVTQVVDAITIIENYAGTDGESTVPTIADYTNAGVTGVTVDNLNAINAVISQNDEEDVSSLSDLQSLITQTTTALIKIETYADTDGASSEPTVEDYENAGITSVTSDNLAEMNARIISSDPGDLDTFEEIQSTATNVAALNVIETYADTAGASTEPTVEDYTNAGVTGVTIDNLDAINEAIREAGSTGVNSLADIQALTTEAAESFLKESKKGGGTSTRNTNRSIKEPKKNESKITSSVNNGSASAGGRSVNITEQISNIILKNQSIFKEAQKAGIKLPDYVTTVLNSSGRAGSIEVRDLMLGMEGEDVLKLQQLLNTTPYPLAAIGVGSTGNETTYFGTLTEAALAKYQAANGISPAIGYFGSITRTQMKNTNLNGLWW